MVVFAAAIAFRARTSSILRSQATFSLVGTPKSLAPTRTSSLLLAGGSLPSLDDNTKERLEKIITSHKVVLFMKGNKLFPQW